MRAHVEANRAFNCQISIHCYLTEANAERFIHLTKSEKLIQVFESV